MFLNVRADVPTASGFGLSNDRLPMGSKTMGRGRKPLENLFSFSSSPSTKTLMSDDLKDRFLPMRTQKIG